MQQISTDYRAPELHLTTNRHFQFSLRPAASNQDVYSVGVIIFEAYFGTLPELQEDGSVRWSEYKFGPDSEGESGWLRDMLRKMLKISPAGRPSAESLVRTTTRKLPHAALFVDDIWSFHGMLTGTLKFPCCHVPCFAGMLMVGPSAGFLRSTTHSLR